MKRFLLYLFVAIPSISFAQSNFHKGYVVTNSNDTLKGYINYRERSLNPMSVQFKSMLDSKPQNFTLKNSSAYEVSGQEKFQRFTVDISMSTIDIARLSLGPDSSSRRDTVFLKVLQEGKNVTLYAYKDDTKNRYYIKDRDSSEPKELVYELYLNPDNRTSIVTSRRFGGQLLDLLLKYSTGSNEDSQKLRHLNYDETDMLKVVSQINQQEIIKSKYSRARFFAGTGISLSKTAYEGENDLANAAAKNKSSVSPILTAGVDVFANPAIGKLIYRLELSLVQSKNDISTTTSTQSQAVLTHTFDQYTAMVVPQIIYNIYNTVPLKIFFGAGFAMNFSKFTNNKSSRYNSVRNDITVTENLIDLEAYSSALPIKIGFVFHKRIEFSAIYTRTTAITNYNSFSIGVQRYTLGLNYLFGK